MHAARARMIRRKKGLTEANPITKPARPIRKPFSQRLDYLKNLGRSNVIMESKIEGEKSIFPFLTINDFELKEGETEENVKARVSAAYTRQMQEGFAWMGDVEIYDRRTKNLVKVVALHPVTTYHPGQWPEVRHYVERELKKVAKTFRGGYICLDHYWFYDPPYEILDSVWDEEDCRIEMLCYVPQDITERIRNGTIKHVSVDMDWEILRKMNGVVPEGLKGLGVSFLEQLQPGDPRTSVELLNAWGKLMIEKARQEQN